MLAAAKLMGNKDLVYVAAKIRTVTRCRNTLSASAWRVRRSALQPNHPTTDDLAGILVSAVEAQLRVRRRGSSG